MKSFLSLIILLVGPWQANAPMVRAVESSHSIEQCRRGRSGYELDLDAKLEVENLSSQRILLPKDIDMVTQFFAATTKEDAEKEKYVLQLEQHFGGASSVPSPRRADFIALEPGAKTTVSADIVITGSTDPHDAHAKEFGLGPGTYWVQLRFSAIPFAFWANDVDRLEKEWKSGAFVRERVLTEPFKIVVLPDPKAPKCGR